VEEIPLLVGGIREGVESVDVIESYDGWEERSDTPYRFSSLVRWRSGDGSLPESGEV
jgi:hypothetical protein